jgi:inosine/xanthosine triphosphatase
MANQQAKACILNCSRGIIRLQQSAVANVKPRILRGAFDRKRRSVIASDARLSGCASFQLTTLNPQTPAEAKTIALGSDRAAKIMAVRASLARIAEIDPAWAEANIIARKVETNVPAMPLNDWQLMQGARERALAVRDLLQAQRRSADVYVGLEGGFHSISIEGDWHTFLRGWAYATDGKNGTFGATPSISVPASLAKKVIEGRRELGLVIDEVAGVSDVRSRQGAWGILSRDLVTRSMSFEVALIAALAPFYNQKLYSERD